MTHLVAITTSERSQRARGRESEAACRGSYCIHAAPGTDSEEGMMRDLLSCPFCGFKAPRLVQLKDGRWAVKCECGVSTGPKKQQGRALNAWNVRTGQKQEAAA